MACTWKHIDRDIMRWGAAMNCGTQQTSTSRYTAIGICRNCWIVNGLGRSLRVAGMGRALKFAKLNCVLLMFMVSDDYFCRRSHTETRIEV